MQTTPCWGAKPVLVRPGQRRSRVVSVTVDCHRCLRRELAALPLQFEACLTCRRWWLLFP